MKALTHQEVESLLADRVLQYLSPELEERIKQHLKWCWVCRVSLYELEAIWLFSDLPTPAVNLRPASQYDGKIWR